MDHVHLPLIIETDEDSMFIVSCPMFKGCHTYGETMDEAMANIREVIAMCMEEEPLGSTNKFLGFREIEVPLRADS